jgi:O-antigen/teichoic acid export membrane protein
MMLVNVRLYSQYLSQSELGIYFFLLTASYFANALLFVPIDFFQQANNLYDLKHGKINSTILLLKKTLHFFFIVSLIVCVFFFFFYKKFLLQLFLCISLAVLVFLSQTLRNSLNNLGFSKLVSINYIVESFIKVFSFYLFCIFLNGNVNSNILVLTTILSLLFSSIFSFYYLRKNVSSEFSGNSVYLNVSKVLNFSYPLSISALSNWFQNQGYRIILVPLGYTEFVGIYSTISNIGSSAVGALNVIFNNHFVPFLYSSNGTFLKKFNFLGSILIFVTFIFCYIFSDFFVSILLTKEFLLFSKVICFGIVADGLNIIIGGLTIKASLKDKNFATSIYSFIGLLTSLACLFILYNFKLVTVYSIGFTLVVSQLIVVFFMLINSK